MYLRAFFALAAAMMAACQDPDPIVFFCNTDRDCSRPDDSGWRCIFDGDTGEYCAVPERSCPSGYRWSVLSLRKIANQCVDPSLLAQDGGSD